MFGRLEEEVAVGRIGCYGIFFNIFGSSDTKYNVTFVARVLECARVVAGDEYYFSVL